MEVQFFFLPLIMAGIGAALGGIKGGWKGALMGAAGGGLTAGAPALLGTMGIGAGAGASTGAAAANTAAAAAGDAFMPGALWASGQGTTLAAGAGGGAGVGGLLSNIQKGAGIAQQGLGMAQQGLGLAQGQQQRPLVQPSGIPQASLPRPNITSPAQDPMAALKMLQQLRQRSGRMF